MWFYKIANFELLSIGILIYATYNCQYVSTGSDFRPPKVDFDGNTWISSRKEAWQKLDKVAAFTPHGWRKTGDTQSYNCLRQIMEGGAKQRSPVL